LQTMKSSENLFLWFIGLSTYRHWMDFLEYEAQGAKWKLKQLKSFYESDKTAEECLNEVNPKLKAKFHGHLNR
jgi:hypothetical protein